MAAVRCLPVLLLLVAALSACGGGGGSSSSDAPDPSAARSTTVAEGTARFTVLIDATISGNAVRSSETGTISFRDRRAHVYKLLPGGGVPQELIFVGPYTYANANVEAALQDRSVKPWTKLDTRRLSAKQRNSRPDELAHVRVLVHLPDGIDAPTKLDSITVANERVTQFRGLVHPAQVVADVPAAERPGLAQALRNDYPARPFFASFWLDDAGRVRRVLVSYNTPAGSEISLDGRFSNFGTKVDVKPPPARSIEDITP
jgi:hypothetical protein